jgi:hypothetical protein
MRVVILHVGAGDATFMRYAEELKTALAAHPAEAYTLSAAPQKQSGVVFCCGAICNVIDVDGDNGDGAAVVETLRQYLKSHYNMSLEECTVGNAKFKPIAGFHSKFVF